MAKVRVYELAKELGIESKVLVAKLQDMGEFVRSASSTIEAPVIKKVKEAYPAEAASAKAAPAAPAKKAPAKKAAAKKAAAQTQSGRPRRSSHSRCCSHGHYFVAPRVVDLCS